MAGLDPAIQTYDRVSARITCIRYSWTDSGAHMFKKETVFILGAGASWHYGYPTGEELVKRVKGKARGLLTHLAVTDLAFVAIDAAAKSEMASIKEELARAEYVRQSRPKHAVKDTAFEEFLSDLKVLKSRIEQANPLVIDDFLGRNDGIANVGKLLIALVLFDCEKMQEIRPRKIDDKGNDIGDEGDWVRYIVQHLTVDCETPEKLLDNKVTFVTFNYDLSLERRLHAALKNYQWFAKDGYSEHFFDPINGRNRVYHVYGQLYDFSPVHPNGPENTYSNESFPLVADIDRAYNAAQNIQTIAPDEKVVAPEIVKAIADAKYLYFLGYGFDHRNNKLLGLGVNQCPSGPQRISFTNYGNSNKVSKSVERIYAPEQGVLDVNGVPLGSLLGDQYRKRSYPRGSGSKFHCEKSIKSVYDALAVDFDWPE
jgi:hypothetical protein